MRLAAIFFTMMCLSAADRPNFTGTWKMNPDQSSFGQLPRPVEYERRIDHKDPVIAMTVRQVSQSGEQTVDLKVRTDGQESVNTSRTGEGKTVGKWMGRDLQLTTTREVDGGQAVTREKWSLSEDGKTLTSLTEMKTPRSAFEIKLVLEKQ